MRTRDKDKPDFIPALRFKWLTSLYDPVLKWTMRESVFKNQLIMQFQVDPGQQILDLGCGTGTLAILLKQTYPTAEVTGLDIDPKVIEIAEEKALNLGMNVTFNQGIAFELPYADHSFDRVVTSLMLHHLTLENKRRTLQEIFRVLKPEGELHVADWGKAQNGLMRAAFLSIQILDGFKTTSDNVTGLLPQIMTDAGFDNPQETDRFMTLFGTLSLYKAKKNTQ